MLFRDPVQCLQWIDVRLKVPVMRQFAAFAILVALFILLVATRFKPSDGDKLAAISRVAVGKVREALPPAARIAGPVNALRRELPERIEDRVKDRIDADNRLEGAAIEVGSEGATVILRGVAPSAKARRTAVSIAEHTNGVEKVMDELAVPEN
jgi:hyperosmotically inducible periplasmic protein